MLTRSDYFAGDLNYGGKEMIDNPSLSSLLFTRVLSTKTFFLS